MIGLPDMRPSSFRNAITEPVKVTAPMAAPIDISTRLAPGIAPGRPMPKAAGPARPLRSPARSRAGSLTSSPCRLGRRRFAPLIHRKHALRDQEPAEDVDRGEDQRDEAEGLRPPRPAAGAAEPDSKQRPDDDHAR